MDDIIAERELTFRRHGSDVDKPVVVRLGRPHVGQHAPAYTMPYEVVCADGCVISRYSVGEDSMQALSLVYLVLHAHFESMRREGRLTWGDSEDLGIPSGR